MPEARLPSISARSVASYMSCPRRFYLQEVEKGEPPYLPPDALKDALETVIYDLLANRAMSEEEMLARYEVAFAGVRTLIRRSTDKTMQPLETMGKRLLLQFRALELPAIEVVEIKPKIERLAQVEEFQFTLSAQPSIMEKRQLGFFRITSRNYSGRELMCDLEIVLSCFVADWANAYAIVFTTAQEGLRRQSIRDFGSYAKWSLLCAAEAIKGIEAERFPPCDPITWYCRRGACRWYDTCGRNQTKRGR